MPTTSPTVMPTREEMKAAEAKAQPPQASLQLLKMVVYGKPKRGKTHFLGTFPKPLILDFDGSAGMLANKKKFPDFDGKVVRVESWKDVEMWYWILKTQKHSYQTVAWDTVTNAGEIVVNEVLGDKLAKNSDKDPYFAEMQDYGRVNRVLRTWIPMFKNLPMHVVFTAHEREDDAPDEEDGEELVRWMVPDLQKGVRGFLLGLVATIGYSYRVSKDGKLSFRMAFDRTGTVASDRYSLLPRAMANPSFKKIMHYYNGEGAN